MDATLRLIDCWPVLADQLRNALITENEEFLAIQVETLAPTFDALRPLKRLEQLRVQHMPNVTSLDALSGLGSLRRLILETRPSRGSVGNR